MVVVAGTTPHMGQMVHDFSKNPLLVYWEMTQACGLACKHCRAEAMPTRQSAGTLDGAEQALPEPVSRIRQSPSPSDSYRGRSAQPSATSIELIDYANGLGLEVSITPSATPELTNDAITKLKAHGIQSLGLSLDGSCAEKHDAIRAVPGTFEHTMEAARHCGRLGLPIQVNTLVSEETADDLPAIYELLCKEFPVMRWSLFMLISVGRGKALNEVSPERGERIMRWVFELSQHSPFLVKTTEAPSYRRIAIEKMRASGKHATEMKSSSVYTGFQIRDGHGIVFVSNLGEIYPSGFLPLRCGNVRVDSLVRGLPELGSTFRSLAFARHVPRKVRGLRIQPRLRRLARARLRLHRRRARHRPVLPV